MKIKHIAIIMDGNGRWAARRGLPRVDGHRAGAKAAARIGKAARKLNLPYLTLYALSTENLERPRAELDALAALMRDYLENEVPVLIEKQVRLKVIGDRALVSADLRKKIERAERLTKDGRVTLCLAVCYGGRDDIVRAARELASGPSNITESSMARALDTNGIPDPDLLIRTGGDYRVSNFLLWQAAYAELYFTKTLWPDFGTKHLKAAINAFEKRERRFGKIGETAPAGKRPGKRRLL